MARFNAVVLAFAAGAVFGTTYRPGVVEVAGLAVAVCAVAALQRLPQPDRRPGPRRSAL